MPRGPSALDDVDGPDSLSDSGRLTVAAWAKDPRGLASVVEALRGIAGARPFDVAAIRLELVAWRSFLESSRERGLSVARNRALIECLPARVRKVEAAASAILEWRDPAPLPVFRKRAVVRLRQALDRFATVASDLDRSGIGAGLSPAIVDVKRALDADLLPADADIIVAAVSAQMSKIRTFAREAARAQKLFLNLHGDDRGGRRHAALDARALTWLFQLIREIHDPGLARAPRRRRMDVATAAQRIAARAFERPIDRGRGTQALVATAWADSERAFTFGSDRFAWAHYHKVNSAARANAAANRRTVEEIIARPDTVEIRELSPLERRLALFAASKPRVRNTN